MISRIVRFAVMQPLFVVLGVVVLVGAGAFAFVGLPIEAFPDVSDTQVTVITLHPGHAAEEVERQVTMPIEVALSGVPNSVRLFSHTQFGLSFVILTFNDKANDYFARQQVLERLKSVELPDGVEPNLAPMSTAIGEIFRYRVRGTRQTPTELRTIEEWVIERRLKTVPGVADVVSLGGLIKQYEVSPDAARMKDYRVTLPQLLDALSKGNSNAGGGYVDRGDQQFLIRGLGLLRSAEEIGQVVVTQRNGSPVLVRDIAAVRIGSVPRQGVVGQDDEDDVVTGIVLMRKGENPSNVLEALKERVQTLNRSVLPTGVSIEPFYDRTWLIEKTLRTVFVNLVEGAMLVTLVLLVFLGNLRAALFVALVIPLSLLSTFLGLTFAGIPANLLSLGAMDFGIIVDGAVIVVENVFRRLGEAPEGTRPADRLSRIIAATIEVGRPTVFSMVIIIAAHIPIFTLQRHEGRIFTPMALTVTSALVGSLLVSLTVVPLLCAKLLGRKIRHDEPWVVRACQRLYRPVLGWSIAHARSVVACAALGLAGALALVPRLGSEFLPELNEGSVWVNVTLDPTISLQAAQRQSARIRALIRTVPEVKTVISKAGRPEDGTDPKGVNMTEYLVELKPESEWRPGKDTRALLAQMEAAIESIPGVQAGFSQPVRDNVLESISQIKGQIVVKFFGEDLRVLAAQAQAALGAIQEIPGVAQAFIDRTGEVPQLRIEVRRDRAARHGLNVQDVQDVLETAVAGRVATQVWEGERRFGVVLRLKKDERNDENLRQLLISTPGGYYVPLAEVADFTVGSGRANISREFGTRVLAIGVFIRDRDMGSVVSDMQAAVARSVKLPDGYSVQWSGEFENQKRAMQRLAWVVPLSILIIYLLLFDAFKSLRSATLILVNIPLALVGGILALFLTGIPLSVSAAIGFIALFGQAVLNGVVMVSHFNQLRETGMPLAQAIVEGSVIRMRTVLMTGLLAMLGLLPMALSHAIGSETQRPLAVVVIGGLVSATLLTLIVLPAAYRLMFEGRDKADDGGAAYAQEGR